jgi:hypothetical protein
MLLGRSWRVGKKSVVVLGAIVIAASSLSIHEATAAEKSSLLGMLAVEAVPFGNPIASPVASKSIAIGAAVNNGKSSDISLFRERMNTLGPMTFRRSFNSSLPETFQKSAAKDDAKYGLKSFVSWKPPSGDYVGAANGKYDDAVIKWAKSVPSTGVYATAFHEPENDMTGPQFVAMQRHLYTIVKKANPSIQWGPVYMSYWWGKGTSHYIGNPDEWWPGNEFADFSAVDHYTLDAPVPLSQDNEFMTWYRYMAPKNVPLIIAEYGQYAIENGKRVASHEAKRAEVIKQDAAWLQRQDKFVLWMYWDAFGKKNEDWGLRDKASADAWKSLADAAAKG